MTTVADLLPTVSLVMPSPGSPEALVTTPSGVEPDHALVLLKEHSEALLRMARVLTGSNEVARTAVSTVLQGAAGSAGPSRSAVDTRATLAAAVFRVCRAGPGDQAHRADGSNKSIDWVARISAQQRAAVALYLHGAHTPAQIGTLLNLPLRAVCLLLLSAMDELVAADPARGPRRPSVPLQLAAPVDRRRGSHVTGSSLGA